jgi:hypothetical protein
MRRGLLQHYANQVCQMAVGWRLGIVDLPLLLERGKGTVAFDLLTGTTALDDEPVSLTIMDDVGAWLDEAKLRDGLPDDLITQFTMRMHFDITEETAGGLEQRSVGLKCHSALSPPTPSTAVAAGSANSGRGQSPKRCGSSVTPERRSRPRSGIPRR